MSTSKKAKPIAIVTPWWSENCAGGAEFLAREVAHQLLGRGFCVEVLTTCGRSAFDNWAEDYFPPGTVEENGLTVHRFSLDRRDEGRFARLYESLADGRFLSPSEEQEFLNNSINSRTLYSFVEDQRERYCFCFLPYLYGTTYFGVLAASGRAIIIPCLHNEPIAYLLSFQRMMASARGLWFLSEPEYYFARALYPIQRVLARVVGAGMDFCGQGDGDRFRSRHGIDGPYILFAGRRVPGKGFGLLLRHFAAFAESHSEWKLVLAGPGDGATTNEMPPNVMSLGFVEKQELWDAMAGATAFCQPSRYESFSYVLMEAWMQGTPVLVNAQCEVLRMQCEMAGGGLWFGDEEEFKRALLYIQTHPDEARRMGRQGREYVASRCRWADVMDRAETLLAACV
jgi:glycosyltransferase involved in cell wall biosynthesis